MKKHCGSAVRNIIAIIMCTAVAFAYFPLSESNNGTSFAAVSWISQVKSAEFIPADPDNYQFYDGADNVPLEQGEEIEDDYYFWDGDSIVAVLNNGETKTITYYEDDESDFGWWEDDDENRLSASDQPRILQTPRLVDLTPPQKFSITIEFAWLTIKQPAELLESPVKTISFTPGGTEESIAERFTMTQGDEEFAFDFMEGDKLTVNIDGTTKDYIVKMEQDEYDPDTYYVAFLDSDNNELPYEYGSVEVEAFDSAKWSVGTQYIFITYGKARTSIPVTVMSNKYSAIRYQHKRTTYTEAELILMESYDEESGYCCYLEPLEGDELTLILSGTGAEETYVYDGSDFRDTDGKVLDEGLSFPDLYYEGPAQAGILTFTADYEFLEAYVTIQVTSSSDSEKATAMALRDAREAAADKIESMLSDLDLSLYREAQQEQLFNEFNKAYEAVWGAATPAEADNIAKAFETFVKGIKTDAQMTEEESKQASGGSGAAGGQTVAAPSGPAEIIDLPAVKISKPKAAKKKLTVKWKKPKKKNLKKIKGIQIQVATDPGFTNIVKTAKAGKKKTSKVIKGLKPKTKYYVRIRAYGAPNHYSAWKSKSGKTK